MNETNNGKVATLATQDVREKAPARTRGVYIKRVPEEVWCHARQNAMRSGVPFRTFVIELLATSAPFGGHQSEKPQMPVAAG